MAHRVASPEFRVSNSQLLFSATSVPFARTALQNEAFGESMVPFYQAMMPMEWRQPLDPREGYPYTSATAQWFQPPSFSDSNTSDDSFVSDLSESDAVPWASSTYAPGVVEQVTMPHEEQRVQSAVGAGYFLLPPEAGPSSSLFASAPLEHREWARQPDYQCQPTGEYGTGHDRKRRAHLYTDADEEVVGPRKKRGRGPAPNQTTEANAALPRYVPIISRGPTSDINHAPITPSPPNSATVPPFALADAYYSSSHYQLGATITAAPSPGAAFTPGQTTSPESPRQKGFHTRRSSDATTSTARSTPRRSITSSTTTSSTATTRPATPSNNGTSPSKPAAQAQSQPQAQREASQTTQSTKTTTTTTHSQTRDRNRAAASRYRAKTQAAVTQLEAAEREVSVRRQSLLACASQLRDEVFQLKNELLRHAGCDCPLIQGYLSHEAEVASAGFRHPNDYGSSPILGRGDQVVMARSHLRT